jgi:hypothetical protein
MQTATVEIDRSKARELYREYKKHQHWSKPIDRECQRAYQHIGLGRLVIQALASVQKAGVYTEGVGLGFPKLALCRADALACTASFDGAAGALTMTADSAQRRVRRSDWSVINSRSIFSWPGGSFPVLPGRKWRATALVPTPPLHLRPKRGLQNYCILWEAEWTKLPPSDPLLLRRIGQADLWLVCAQWDLTSVEKAALSTRVRP